MGTKILNAFKFLLRPWRNPNTVVVCNHKCLISGKLLAAMNDYFLKPPVLFQRDDATLAKIERDRDGQ